MAVVPQVNVFGNDSGDDFQNAPPKTMTRSMQKRLDDLCEARNQKLNMENPCKKTKGKKRNNKKEGKRKLIDEESDEDIQGKNDKEAQTNDKELQMVIKKKMCKKKKIEKQGKNDKEAQMNDKELQKRLDDSNKSRKVKRKLVMEGANNENPSKKPKGKVRLKVKTKRNNINDKKEGKLRLIDEGTDEDMAEATKVIVKVAERKGKMKMCKKGDDKDERKILQKIEERNNIFKKADEIAKNRNSTRLLSDMICALSDEQKDWVKAAGFESLLYFDLVEIPQRLAYKVVQAFDEKTCMLKLVSGDIEISDQAVHDVLGLSCKGAEIKIAQGDSRNERIRLWREQFSITEGQSLVKASEVVHRIKQTEAVDELFKLNFLVMMTNVLISSNTNNSVCQKILSFDDELDKCAKYNWAAYLIKSLVITKKRWMRTSSLFFTGPLLFLIILYVDRVLFGEQQLVSRNHPAFRGWTKDKLKERELLESGEGAFGTGIIREAATAEEIEENASGEPHDGDWFERLNAKAARLVDAKIHLMEAENQYKSELANAKNLHPDDIKIIQHFGRFEYSLCDYFREMDIAIGDDVDADFDYVNGVQAQGTDDAVLRSEQQEVELPPEHDDNVDILNWLNSPEGLVVMQQDYDDMLVPSFSLGLSQICKEVMKEHGEANIDENKEAEENKEGDDKEEDNNITPMDKEPKKRAKRDVKVGPAFRSPFVQRIIDINSKYTVEEFSVWRWIIQAGKNDDEFIFVCGEQNYTRELVKTLKPEKQLSFHVIDMWSILLNEKENYKSQEAPPCIYLDISLSHGPLDEKATPETQFVLFKSNMQHFFERYPDRKIKDTDLVFFPVYAHEHFYLICFNLKKPSLEVIDNIRRGKAAPMQYGKKIKLLHKHFVDYLLDIKLEVLASSVKNVKASYLTMPWQTLANSTDCGVFLMRHMETYKGDTKNWKSELKVEKRGQKMQLERLRAKYCHAILTLPLNEKRNEILSEAKCLYNKIAKEKLMSIVIQANTRSTTHVRGRKKNIEGTVLFR